MNVHTKLLDKHESAKSYKISLYINPEKITEIKENNAMECFTRNYLIYLEKKKFSCLCCGKFIDYFVKKLTPVKCVTRINRSVTR